MDDVPLDDAEVASWTLRIRRAARRRTTEAVAALVKAAAPFAAMAGRLDVLASWLDQLPQAVVDRDPKLLYWSAAGVELQRPAQAHDRYRRAFESLRTAADEHGAILAWAGLLNAIFLMYSDLREVDPLFAWMTPEREAIVDRMPRPLHSLVVGTALFALTFRLPTHPRLEAWRLRADRLIEHDPTSDLSARLTAALILDRTWRGELAHADALWERFTARAARVTLSPMSRTMRHVNEATLRLHQGSLAECLRAVDAGLLESRRCNVRVWDGILCCHGAAAALGRGDAPGARRHIEAIGRLVVEGIPVDEAYHAGMQLWVAFVEGNAIGASDRARAAILAADQKGVPYFRAVSRLMSALVVFEAGERARGVELLEEARAIGRAIGNDVIAWVSGLFEAHMHHANGLAAQGDAALEAALAIGRAHGLAHFFGWPRPILNRLIDRALSLGLHADYVDFLVARHGFGPTEQPSRSDRWQFRTRIYTFGNARAVHADGRVEPLSSQSVRQVELFAALVDRGGRPTPLPTLAAAIYVNDDGDPMASVKHVLHSLRKRIGGECLLQKDNALFFDFGKVWIDACSFQALSAATTDLRTIEQWLDRHYVGHFLDRVEGSPILDAQRRRLSKSVSRVLGDHLAACRAAGDTRACERLESRWRTHFPAVFEAT